MVLWAAGTSIDCCGWSPSSAAGVCSCHAGTRSAGTCSTEVTCWALVLGSPLEKIAETSHITEVATFARAAVISSCSTLCWIIPIYWTRRWTLRSRWAVVALWADLRSLLSLLAPVASLAGRALLFLPSTCAVCEQAAHTLLRTRCTLRAVVADRACVGRACSGPCWRW